MLESVTKTEPRRSARSAERSPAIPGHRLAQPSGKIRVGVADGHSLVRSGMQRLLSEQDGMSVVSSSSSFDEVLRHLRGHRPDVLVYETEPLEAALTMAGPLVADLWVSTSQRDADWVVKVIDVFPDDTPTPDEGVRPGSALGGYQMMVRSEVIRGRYREDYAAPRPFRPGQPTRVELPLQGVLHTFEPGHRVMVQIQSSWFPLVDLNPQSWVENIFAAKAEDFVRAEHRVWRDRTHPSALRFGRLPVAP